MKRLRPITAVLTIVVLNQAACSRPSAPVPAPLPVPGAAAALVGDNNPPPGTGYPPVSKERLLGGHNCWATGPKRADFRFTFDKERFEIQEQGKPIPKEVLEAVLGTGKTAGKIEGRYDLSGDTLILTEIRADGKAGFPDAKIHTFNTGVVRFDFGEVQYVLRPQE
jgi:hypothetical protein